MIIYSIRSVNMMVMPVIDDVLLMIKLLKRIKENMKYVVFCSWLFRSPINITFKVFVSITNTEG